MKGLILALLMALSMFAQNPPSGTAVSSTEGPPREFWSKVFYKSGNYTYICYARPSNTTYTNVAVSAVTAGAQTLFTSTAHGVHSSMTPYVTVSGMPAGSWAALNGRFKATVVDANTLSVAVNSTGFDALTEPQLAAVKVYTYAPRTQMAFWAVNRVEVDNNGDAVSSLWAADGYGAVCSSYATLAYN